MLKYKRIRRLVFSYKLTAQTNSMEDSRNPKTPLIRSVLENNPEYISEAASYLRNDIKLNHENADISSIMMDSHKAVNNSKLAGTVLEASSKVSGVPVDSIHTDSLLMTAEVREAIASEAKKTNEDYNRKRNSETVGDINAPSRLMTNTLRQEPREFYMDIDLNAECEPMPDLDATPEEFEFDMDDFENLTDDADGKSISEYSCGPLLSEFKRNLANANIQKEGDTRLCGLGTNNAGADDGHGIKDGNHLDSDLNDSVVASSSSFSQGDKMIDDTDMAKLKFEDAPKPITQAAVSVDSGVIVIENTLKGWLTQIINKELEEHGSTTWNEVLRQLSVAKPAMTESLTTALAFLAILGLAGELRLLLKQQEELGDIIISKIPD